MMIFKKTTYFIITCSFIVLMASTVFINTVAAQTAASINYSNDSEMMTRLKSVAEKGGFATDSEDTLPVVVGSIINAFISLLGIIFVILIVSAGFTWMTSDGNEEKIKKATSTIKSSVVGLIIALSAWTLWNFIFANLIT